MDQRSVAEKPPPAVPCQYRPPCVSSWTASSTRSSVEPASPLVLTQSMAVPDRVAGWFAGYKDKEGTTMVLEGLKVSYTKSRVTTEREGFPAVSTPRPWRR